MVGISNATFMKAISEGIVKPQLIKGRKKAMYLESEVLKIEKGKKCYNWIISSSFTGTNISFLLVTTSNALFA